MLPAKSPGVIPFSSVKGNTGTGGTVEVQDVVGEIVNLNNRLPVLPFFAYYGILI